MSNKVKIYPHKFNTIVTANINDIPNLSQEYCITIARALRIKSGKVPLRIVQRGDASYIEPYTKVSEDGRRLFDAKYNQYSKIMKAKGYKLNKVLERPLLDKGIPKNLQTPLIPQVIKPQKIETRPSADETAFNACKRILRTHRETSALVVNTVKPIQAPTLQI